MSLAKEYIDEHGRLVKKNKVDTAIFRIQEGYAMSPKKTDGSRDPLWVSYSGGKDSMALLSLVKRAGVPYEAHYRVTSVDPPELVQHIKRQKDVIFDYPRYADGSVCTMWNLIPRRGFPPTPVARYCCAYLKETAGKGRLNLTGVRWSESPRRRKGWGVMNFKGKRNQKYADTLGVDYTQTKKDSFAIDFDELNAQTYDDLGYDMDENTVMLSNDNDQKRKLIEYCVPKSKTVLNPIIDWEEEDVWEYLDGEGEEICALYRHVGGGIHVLAA